MIIVGKTIKSVTKCKHPYYDDTGFIKLLFDDGSECTIISRFGYYTGESYDEYPSKIYIHTGEYYIDDSCSYSSGRNPALPLIPLNDSPYES